MKSRILFAILVFCTVHGALAQAPAPPQAAPPPAPITTEQPKSTDNPKMLPQQAPVQPTLPEVILNRDGDNYGLAQQIAHAHGLQGRIMWIDAGANVGNLNSVEKIDDIVQKIKASGFNMVVLDVKPIVGETIYPSKYADRLTEWKGQTVDKNLDVLHEFLVAAHAAGLLVYANMSTFGEGHKLVHRGLAYTHPTWQTILYEVNRSVSNQGFDYVLSAVDSLPNSPDSLTAVTKQGLIAKNIPGTTIAILNFDARVQQVLDGSQIETLHPVIPPSGAALIGQGTGAAWITQHAPLNGIINYRARPKYVPVTEAPEQLYTMFCDPANPDVRQHEWDIVREVVTNYDVDGMVFDDRLRYAGLNADFSVESRKAFEQVVGKSLKWPDDVFTISPFPGAMPIPGPYYRQWLTWRAGIITSWLDQAGKIVRTTRPKAQVAVYVGSWYGDYYQYGSNWASADLISPFSDISPQYQAAGYAGLLDWITTGCYYWPATLAEAKATKQDLGATVEAAGILSTRVVNDAAWTYAGLYALSYRNNPIQFQRALTAACASSQGVMVFDLSQIVSYDWWPQITQVFATITPPKPGVATTTIANAAIPAQTPTPVAPQSPSADSDYLAELRAAHQKQAAGGTKQERLPSYGGINGIGF